MSAAQLGRLIDEHSTALTLYARSLCDCPEDVVQEAFIQLSGQRPWPDCPQAWLYRAVRNGAMNAARSARRRSQHEATAASEARGWFVASTENLLDAQAAVEAVRGLPDELCEVVVLRLWSQMTFQEIGEVTATSDSTAQRRYVEALNTLRDRLETPCPTN